MSETREKRDAPVEPQKKPAPRKKHPIRKILKYLSLLILFLIIAIFAALGWLTQSTSGQQWLLARVNAILAPDAKTPGLNFKLTSLSGSLPLNFEIGIEARDAQGIWLVAPKNHFAINWRELPGTIHISALSLANIDLARLPDLPPSPPAEPEPASNPMTIADIREILAKTANFLAEKHWWLPNIKVEGVQIANATLPADILGTARADAPRPAANADLALSLISGHAHAKLTASLASPTEQLLGVSSLDFHNASLNCDLNVKPKPDGLDANLGITAGLDKPTLTVTGIPADFLGERATLGIDLIASANTSVNNPGLDFRLKGPDFNGGHVKLHGDAAWSAGSGWKDGAIDGQSELNLTAEVEPVPSLRDKNSPLDILRSPASLRIGAGGNLPTIDIRIDAACQDLEKAGHNIKNLHLALAARDLDLPLSEAGWKKLENEHHINLDLSTLLDKHPINLSSILFVQAPATKAPAAGDQPARQNENGHLWRAGIKDLKLDALGASARGNVTALLPPGAMPRLDGDLKINVAEWTAISEFIPGQKLSGDVKINVLLSHQPDPKAQCANIDLSIPTFAMRQSGGNVVETRNLNGKINASDLFGTPFVDGNIDAAKIAVAGLEFSPHIKAKGSTAGPLAVEINSTGAIGAQLAADWTPGKASLKTLNLSANAASILGGKGKNMVLGLKSGAVAEIAYGENGIAVRNLDLAITPSGKLRANGGFSPQKLDFNLTLDNLAFKPWQALIPQLPAGSANISAKFSGTPTRPSGGFKIVLSDVSTPKVPLAPMGLSLVGNLENRGSANALNARLQLDPKALKSLGATEATVTASVPLLFGANGVPQPDMNGPVAAKVRWEGALGPIWNLLPIPDRRLNGRLAINIDGSGQLEAPRLTGGIKVANARFEDVALGILLTNINLNLNLSDAGASPKKAAGGAFAGIPGSMTLALNATDGRGGTIDVQGKGALDGQNLDVKTKINRLRPLRRRDVHIELSGDAQVTGAATAPNVKGEIIINQGEVLLDNLSVTGSVTTLPITTPEELAKQAKKAASARESAATPAPSPQKAGAGSLNVRVNMLPRFSVDGRGLTSTWEANLLVGGTPANPQITGNISSVKGNFDFLGKVFKLTRGVVTFAGGSLANPLIDVELTNETPDLTANILVSGPVDKIKLTLSSDPQMPRDEIISQVLFGRSVSDLSRLEALQLAAAVAQLAGFGSGGSGIMSFAKKTLGVDVLRLGTSSSGGAGEPGDQTAGGTTIEMGKYINDMIYMGVQQGMQADSTAFIIQLDLTPHSTFEVRSEQNNTWGGFKWKYDY